MRRKGDLRRYTGKSQTSERGLQMSADWRSGRSENIWITSEIVWKRLKTSDPDVSDFWENSDAAMGTVENVSRCVEARVVRNSTRSVQIGGRVREVLESAYQSVIRPLCMHAD